MVRTALSLVLLRFIVGLWPAHAAAAPDAPCAIQCAASGGSHVWLLCDRKELYISADEGATWQSRRVPSDSLLRAIAPLDSRRAFIVGDAGLVLATEDGGETWRKIAAPTEESLTAIQFIGDRGWISGWSGLVLHSADGGKTWQKQKTGVLHGLETIYFADAEHGWAGGWAGTILRTDNGGRTWIEARLPQTLWSIDSIYFRDAKHGWAVGFNGQILSTNDGGVAWRELKSPTQAWLKSVTCDASGRLWISSDYELLLSEDNGQNWKHIKIDGLLFIRHVLPLKNAVWAVGQFGVLKTTGSEPVLSALTTLPRRAEGGSTLE
jgi:photosystem II stability/assembly factor-like uncharacterized protein